MGLVTCVQMPGNKPVRVVLGGFYSPGGRIWGFPNRRGSLRGKFYMRGKSCRRGKPECAEELAGAEEVSCVGEIARLRDCRRYGNSFGGGWDLDDYYYD